MTKDEALALADNIDRDGYAMYRTGVSDCIRSLVSDIEERDRRIAELESLLKDHWGRKFPTDDEIQKLAARPSNVVRSLIVEADKLRAELTKAREALHELQRNYPNMCKRGHAAIGFAERDCPLCQSFQDRLDALDRALGEGK